MKRFIFQFLFIKLSMSISLREIELKNKFEDFINKYNKNYGDNYNLRYKIFKENLLFIEEHNKKSQWKMEINKFSDLSDDEFINKKSSNIKINNNLIYISNYDSSLPEEWDWVQKGAVTDVKNQEECGACWAFSAVGAIEAAFFFKTGNLTSMATQQLVDCSKSFGNNACDGGMPNKAFDFAIQRGICSENTYWYSGNPYDVCNNCPVITKISSYINVESNNENALQQAVYKQPVSVVLNANNFKSYKSGVMDSDCDTDFNHAVLVVGWGELNGKKYWKIKNSWGPDWGDNGYILLERNIADSKGRCGIAISPVYPVM